MEEKIHLEKIKSHNVLANMSQTSNKIIRHVGMWTMCNICALFKSKHSDRDLLNPVFRVQSHLKIINIIYKITCL